MVHVDWGGDAHFFQNVWSHTKCMALSNEINCIWNNIENIVILSLSSQIRTVKAFSVWYNKRIKEKKKSYFCQFGKRLTQYDNRNGWHTDLGWRESPFAQFQPPTLWTPRGQTFHHILRLTCWLFNIIIDQELPATTQIMQVIIIIIMVKQLFKLFFPQSQRVIKFNNVTFNSQKLQF